MDVDIRSRTTEKLLCSSSFSFSCLFFDLFLDKLLIVWYLILKIIVVIIPYCLCYFWPKQLVYQINSIPSQLVKSVGTWLQIRFKYKPKLGSKHSSLGFPSSFFSLCHPSTTENWSWLTNLTITITGGRAQSRLLCRSGNHLRRVQA